MTYSVPTITMRRVEENIPADWRMFATVIPGDGTKYILWIVHLEPSPYQRQFADISCDEEKRQARDMCKDLLNMPDPPRRLTGGYTSVEKCMQGFLSVRCGGNPI